MQCTRLRTRVVSLIGRTNDAAVIHALLTNDERLVTVVTGPAGIGKTRLAREVISTLSSTKARAPLPVIECDLVHARTRDDVSATLACAIGAHAGGPDVFATIAARMASCGPTLLLLDGFELLSCAHEVLRPILDAAPRLKVLVTSRAPLGLDYERVHELGPLSLQESIAIVRERVIAAAALEGASLDGEEESALVRVVEVLGGVPLALELAALCIAGRGATELARQLRIDALAHGSVPLEELVRLSWRALAETERSVLASCSIFRGGFTADALMAVAGTDRLTVDAVQSLTDKALLATVRHDPTSVRLVLQRAIREYAAERLDAEDERFARHAAYYIEAGEAWARDASTLDGASAFERLALERGNFVAVVEHALARGDGTTAARGLLVLLPVELAHGPIEPYLDVVNRALDLPMPIDQRIMLLSARGRALRLLGDLEGADRDQQEAVTLARGAGFRREEARLLSELGMAACSRCDFDAAFTLLQTALALQTVLGDAAEQAVTSTGLATVHRELGALDEAREAAMRALPVHRMTGDRRHEATTLAELARCDLDVGDLDRARAELCSALEVGSGDPVLAAHIRCFLAAVEHIAGNLDLAEQHYAAAIHASRELGYLRLEGVAFVYVGILSLDRGDLAVATERLEHGLGSLRGSNDRRYAALATGYLAACALLTGHATRAAPLFTESRSLIAESDPLRTAIDIVEATVNKTSLPPRALEQAMSSWEARHALERWERSAGSTPTETVEPDCLFQVSEDGAWMEYQGRHVECSRRAATQRLLAALARARADTPGRPIPTDDLVAAGWPNEHILSAAAKNRLRVALSWLRKNGLGPALMSRAEGYYLDPHLVGVIPYPHSSDVVRRR